MGVTDVAFNAVTPQLLAASKKADDAGGQIAQMMHALLENLRPMQQGFVGAAGLTFQKVQADVNNDLIIITDALHEVAEGVRTAGRDFDVADTEAQADVTKAAQDAGSIVTHLRGGATA
jgi:WXG100 family type VII secretion target